MSTDDNGRHEALDLLIVGAGFAGLYLLHRARGLGLRARVVESAPDVGGTWYWNAYPGARCDVDSVRYCYTFDKELQEEWQWSERFATQPEILSYLRHVADRFDLRRDISFDTRVTNARFDRNDDSWHVATDDGERIVARFLVAAVGTLSTHQVPAFEGVDDFGGEILHTARWPHDDVDLTGKRVVVIGTGSSGIQSIPQIAARAAHVTVLQRTPNYSVPARNGPTPDDVLAEIGDDYPGWRDRYWEQFACGSSYRQNTEQFDDYTTDEIQRLLTASWERGGAGFLGPFATIYTDRRVNDVYADFVKARIRETVANPETAALLSGQDYPIGTKRICVDTDYYATFNRPNVRLKDVRTHPIVRFLPDGVETADEDIPADVIVLATGFDAMTGPLFGLGLENGDGLTLKDKWENGPSTFFGLMTAGFPNLFLVTGPASPAVLSNMVCSIEQHVEWITDVIDHARSHGHHVVEARVDAEQAWMAHAGRVAEGSLYLEASSWYVGANIPGKPRVILPYLGGSYLYTQRLEQMVEDDYAGLEFRA